MTDREKLARQWAESRQQFDNRSERERAAADYILDNIEPQTPPTMADVEWDGEKHYLAGATDSDGDPCVMVSKWPVNEICAVNLAQKELFSLPADYFTPNGKRYELREVTVSSNENVGADQPDHPKVLFTVEDFENAPTGTVVAFDGGYPYVKRFCGEWDVLGSYATNDVMAADQSNYRVLRWGWDE